MKDKNKKSTLNNHHRIILEKFKKENKKLPKYKTELEKLRSKIIKLEKKSDKDCTDKEIQVKFSIRDNIINLENKIKSIQEQKEKTNYFLNTFDLLNDYFENKNNCSECDISEPEEENQNTLLNFFKKKDDSQMSMDKFINKKNKVNKTDLYERYLNKIEPKYSGKYEFINNFDLCPQCKIKKMLIQNEGRYVCPGCGRSDNIIIDSEKPSYKEAMSSDCSSFAYKRSNHFSEWLNKFQAKESTSIPNEIYDSILYEIKKEKISNLRTIDYIKMREILKKLELNKYYDHVHHIISRINGEPPPKLSKELEERLKNMFKQIQEPFAQCCPDHRTNFLSYSYVIRKFLELVGENRYIKFFPLLKSREKLYHQDMIFKCICKKLKWDFYPSI